MVYIFRIIDSLLVLVARMVAPPPSPQQPTKESLASPSVPSDPSSWILCGAASRLYSL